MSITSDIPDDLLRGVVTATSGFDENWRNF
jgi:hypothetical protein